MSGRARQVLQQAAEEIVAAERLLRVSEVARMTGLRVSTIKAEADAGELPCVRLGEGRQRLFQRAALEIYCRRIGLTLPARSVGTAGTATTP